MFIDGDAQKSEILLFWLSWGIAGIIFTTFGAHLRKATDCKQVVRSTLLHLLVQGGPKGKNPGFNISYELEILNWKLNPIYIASLPRSLKTMCIDIWRFDCVGFHPKCISKGFVSNEKCYFQGCPKFRFFIIWGVLRRPRASFLGISARSCAKQILRSARAPRGALGPRSALCFCLLRCECIHCNDVDPDSHKICIMFSVQWFAIHSYVMYNGVVS